MNVQRVRRAEEHFTKILMMIAKDSPAHVDDLASAFENLNAAWRQREEKLELKVRAMSNTIDQLHERIADL